MTTYFTTGTPDWGPVGQDIYDRTYSRIKANGDRETWFDTVVRVVEGNTKFVDSKFIEKNEKEELFNLIYNFRAIPAGRHLWVTGVPGRQFISNCWNSHWYDKFSTHFTFLFERLMEGGGVGTNYSTKYLRQYSQIKHGITVHFVCTPEHKDYKQLEDYLSEQYSPDWSGAITIADSREGWVEGLRKVIDSAFEGSPPLNGTVPANTIVFDVSQIRPQGAKIKSFGGTASGPFALMEMLCNVNKILSDNVGSKPTSMICMDIDHEIGHCVVSGNVRRSARMSMKYWKDDDIMDFLGCKADGMRHWTTNISVVIDNLFFRKLKEKDKLAKKIARHWAKGQLSNGEPGFYNISKASEGEPTEAFTTNPCLSGENWVITNEGPRPIKSIINRGDLSLLLNGKWVPITDLGFFKTGEKPTFKLITKSGHSIIITEDHKVLVHEQGKMGFNKKAAKDLTSGDLICIAEQKQPDTPWKGEGTFEQGWLLGLLIGDGCISGERAYIDTWGDERNLADKAADILRTTTKTRSHFGVQSLDKYDKSRVTCKSLRDLTLQFSLTPAKFISSSIEKASSAFYKGFLRGFFDADGSVQGTIKKGYSIRLSQSDLIRLQKVQRMLGRVGIFSKIYENRREGDFRELPDGHGKYKEYYCQDQHELVITSDQMIKFRDIIGFESKAKKEKLNNILNTITPYKTKFISEFKELKPHHVIESVYDVQVPEYNVLDCNGFIVSNCGEITFSLPNENCNLGHVNVSAFVDNKSGFFRACRLMARFLIRATYADFPNPGAKQAIEINRRIGVGIFGLQGWLNLQGIRFSEAHENTEVRRFLQKAREVIRKEARDYAFQLRIPEPIKVTTVAPTGTISKMPGTSEGIHPIFGRYFIRRIMFSLLDPLQKQKIQEYEALGYPVEDSVYAANTKLVSFYVKDPLVDQVVAAGFDESVVEQAGEIDLDDMLAVQAMVQQEFADNAISFTINIQPNRYKIGDLVRAMRTWGPRLKGSTIMPMISNRPQMPYQQITKEEYEAAKFKQLGQGSIECPNNVCPIK